MQEMLFVAPKVGYARPHKHLYVAESHVVVDGEGYCILFEDDGTVKDIFHISTTDNFIYRIQKNIWHMIMPITDKLVIYEVREGKFDKNTNIFSRWAPETDSLEIGSDNIWQLNWN